MILDLRWQTRIRDWYWTDNSARARVGHVSSFGSVLENGYLRALLTPPFQPSESFRDARIPYRQYMVPHPSVGGLPPDVDEEDAARAIDAFDECREMARIWGLLDQQTRELITLAYALDRPRPRDVFGPWGAVAHLTEQAEILYSRARSQRTVQAWLDSLSEKLLSADDLEARRASDKVRTILVACEMLVAKAGERFMDAVQVVCGRRKAA